MHNDEAIDDAVPYAYSSGEIGEASNLSQFTCRELYKSIRLIIIVIIVDLDAIEGYPAIQIVKMGFMSFMVQKPATYRTVRLVTLTRF